MWRASFVRWIGVVFIAWIAAQSAALAQSVYDVGALNNQAAQLYNQGKYEEAIEIAEQALSLAERVFGPEHPNTYVSVNNLAGLYAEQGRYSEAEPLYERALALAERVFGPEHPNTLMNVNAVAAIYDTQGRYGEAEPLYQRALAAREKKLGMEHSSTLESVNNLGFLYLSQGRYGEAGPLFQRALAGFEKALGPEHPDTLAIVNNLGYVYQVQGRYTEAEPLSRRALASREKALGREHRGTLASVNNLALLYQAQGRYGEAEPLYQRALAGSEKALGPEHPETLQSVNNLGFLYQAQGRNGEAEPLFQRALAGNEKALGPEHPSTITSVNNLAGLNLARRNWQEAAQYWRRSTVAIAKRVQRDALGAELTGKKASEAQQLDWQFWGLVKVAHRLEPSGQKPDAASASEMFQTAQWALSSEAAQSLAQMAVRGAKGDPALAAVLRERQDLVDEWQRREKVQAAALGQETVKRNAKAEADNHERMAAIDKRIAEIDVELKDKFPDYAALASPAPLTVQEVQALLRADEALVLFLDTKEWKPTPEETFIWIVTKTEVRWMRSDLGKAALSREVQALRCGLDRAAWDGQSRCPELTGQAAPGALPPFDPARANRLYTALLGQAEDLIKGKHLLIVPSGALTQLPFAVLVSAAPKAGGKTAWLARDHAITVLPAVSSLKALRATGHPSASTKPLIGFANPLLNGPGGFHSEAAKLARENQSCPRTVGQRVAAVVGLDRGLTPIETRRGFADPALIRQASPLPETTDEVCAVARSLGADTNELRLGARATEREIKELSENGGLAQYRIVHFATHGAMAGELRDGAEPGLILTPPDKVTQEDDGYLSASEIAALKLDADWVILSACNTAAGSETSAEALSGLARAFIYAQTRALLVSHWYVDSQATVALITAAMREIGADNAVGRAEALRRAMLSLIDSVDTKQAHPSRWAPFIVVGEGAHL